MASNIKPARSSSVGSRSELRGEAEVLQMISRKRKRRAIKSVQPEERKQRNRNAQAVSRARQRAHTMELEDSLKKLRLDHRKSTQNCLELQLRNSELERILFQKGKSQKSSIPRHYSHSLLNQRPSRSLQSYSSSFQKHMDEIFP